MQMPITKYISPTAKQPSVSILFNKALDTSTEPLKVKIENTLILMNALQIQGEQRLLTEAV